VARRTVNEAELVDAADAMRQFCQVMKDRLNEVGKASGSTRSWSECSIGSTGPTR
jgi:hypothetical protein